MTADAHSPRVSVIIPHYADLDRLDLCLQALGAQTFTDFEIVVGDNASPCGLDAVEARAAGRARVIVQPEKGAGPARNAAVLASDGNILAFTDADCLPDMHWLEAGVAALGESGIVGGRMLVSVASEHGMTPTEAFECVFAFDNETYVRRDGFSVTANLFTHRRTFDAAGPFRTGVSEDAEWCQRAVSAGHVLSYAPDAIVSHPARRSWHELARKWDRLGAESYAFHLDSGKSNLSWIARSWALPPSIIAHLPRIWLSDRIRGSGARLGASVILARIRLRRFFRNHLLVWRSGSDRGG